MNHASPLLDAQNISKKFSLGSRLTGTYATLHAVDNVSFSVMRGETFAIIGESGCGKSTLARCLLRLIEPDSGKISFDGIDIRNLNQKALRNLRPRLQMVFQDSHTSLNPRRRIGDLLAEPLRVHKKPDGEAWKESDITARVADMVNHVGLSQTHLLRYAHEFSGGQRQRIGIARALMLTPDLVIADEPVSALDVSVQAQIINLMMDLQQEFSLTYIFIAHDLAVVRQIATRVGVMYLGSLVETGDTDSIFGAPSHPYTASLLASVPRIAAAKDTRALPLGEMPSPLSLPPGCRFHTRCPRAAQRCREERPALRPTSAATEAACHFPL
jgi:peptide/nickel transport system ATP-binding protein